jgi:two-component system sensor histidine kinase/response regulator
VLVIEDSALANALMQRMVQSLGWAVDCFDTSAQALSQLQSVAKPGPDGFPYDLVYTHWGLSGTDGWELTRQVRQLASQLGNTQPLVVIVTGHGRQMLSQHSEQELSLIDGFVAKPVTASMLAEAYADAKAGTFAARKLTLGRSSQRQLAGMRVLVVEDNLINQQVAEELLDSEGALVSLAANGQQGVDAVQAATPQFDVVLMDIQMPVLDGYAATRVIRQELQLHALPIVAMTANAMDSDREACLAAGMNEHVGKPFDLAKLVALLIQITGFCPEPAPPVPLAAPLPPTLPEPGPDGLPNIPGLDLADALERLSGMRELYASLAKDFCDELGTTDATLRGLLEHGDWPGMRMHLHTLKGNAATLGATALSAKAAQLEAVCKSGIGVETLPKALDQLQPLLADAQQSLLQASELLAPPSTPDPHNLATTAPHAQDAQQQALLTEDQTTSLRALDALLAASDLEALSYFAEVRAQLHGQEALCAALEEALQDLDLEKAHGLCQAALSAVAPHDT